MPRTLQRIFLIGSEAARARAAGYRIVEGDDDVSVGVLILKHAHNLGMWDNV
jgi:hypothetical protein